MANEKRLIDANALRKSMFSYYGCVDENSRKEYYRGETLMNYEVADLIEDCIDNAPTVEVVHGRWELHGDDDDLSGSYFCSQCGYNMDEDEYLDNFSHFKYCPNCGAKMDGERKCNEKETT